MGEKEKAGVRLGDKIFESLPRFIAFAVGMLLLNLLLWGTIIFLGTKLVRMAWGGEVVYSVTPEADPTFLTDLVEATACDSRCKIPEYDRDEWRHWIDEDGDCQDTRQEVLIRDSTCDVVLSDDTCRVLKGCWRCPYTGKIFDDPAAVQIDHVVALSEAHRSGGWMWSADKKQQYANYLKDPGHLVVSSARANIQKSDKAPDAWMPDVDQCKYVRNRLRIKAEWGLTLTADEVAEVVATKVRCALERAGCTIARPLSGDGSQ